MLRGLEFEAWTAPADVSRNRVDVACFLGLVRRTGHALPPSVLAWLVQEGWADAPGQPVVDEIRHADPWELPAACHLPIPIDDWSTFERLFDVHATTSTGDGAAGYLPAAVRSFFAQGGRRCFVISVGPPMAWSSTRAARMSVLSSLLPQVTGNIAAIEPTARAAWRGIGLLHGLEEVSFLCLPDLPFLVAADVAGLEPLDEPVLPRDAFEECSEHLPAPAEEVRLMLAAPRCDREEYLAWAHHVGAASAFLERFRRDVQLVAAVPLPRHGSPADRGLLAALSEWGILAETGSRAVTSLVNRFVQLVFPWWEWPTSRDLPERLEPPDGGVVGILARATLLRGTHRSAASQPIHRLLRLEPELSRAQQENEIAGHSLLERISLIGRSVDGPALLSDVTTSDDEIWRSANIGRLQSVWLRALRQAGEAVVFEPSAEATWASVRDRVDQIGRALYRNGALRGRNAGEAYSVRCDRTTMSQRDFDTGRLIAEISYLPAAPVGRILVAMALTEDQRVSLVREATEAET